jgi:DNA-binding MarR family transcriptional regulator
MKNNGNVTSRKLADFLLVSPTAITGHLDELEKAENIERVRSTDDRRLVFLKMTTKGANELEQWRKELLKSLA